MPVVCAGINHETAPVRLRERLAFSPGRQQDLFSRMDLDAFERQTGLGELAILSTCNRVEIYGAARDPGRQFRHVPRDLIELLVDGRDISLDSLVYTHHGTGAVRHLCRVAAGLDSMVLGESEILGQVQSAYERALAEQVAGPTLDAVFHTALRAGRRARAETGIARKPASVSSEAIRVAQEMAGSLTDRRVLVVGSGKMGRLAGRVLRANGVRDLTVVSRTTAHAESLAGEWGARALGWHDLAGAIRETDVVFTSTGAPHAVITVELLQSALGPAGRETPLLLVDIAVPRDVETGARDLPNVRVVDIDEIQRRLDANLADRERAVPTVQVIIADEVRRFEEWWRANRLRPLITAMRSRTEEIRREELDRVLRKLGDVAPEVRAQLDKFSRSLINKVLHEPTRRLKEETDPDRSGTYQRVARELFGLRSDDSVRAVSGM